MKMKDIEVGQHYACKVCGSHPIHVEVLEKALASDSMWSGHPPHSVQVIKNMVRVVKCDKHGNRFGGGTILVRTHEIVSEWHVYEEERRAFRAHQQERLIDMQMRGKARDHYLDAVEKLVKEAGMPVVRLNLGPTILNDLLLEWCEREGLDISVTTEEV